MTMRSSTTILRYTACPRSGCAITARAASAGTPTAASGCSASPTCGRGSRRCRDGVRGCGRDRLQSRWPPVGFDVGWLAQFGAPRATHVAAAPDDRTEVTEWPWTAAGIAGDLPEGSWPRYLGDCAHQEESLRALLVDGFVLLRDVPCEPGTVLAVAGTMGFVRETNYGRLFDMRVEATPDNLAFTGLAIGPHTDNPYRDPVLTVQLLHCLASGAGRSTPGWSTASWPRSCCGRKTPPHSTCSPERQ